MKNTLKLTTVCLVLLIYSSSCNSTKEATAQRKADIEQSKQAVNTCFIQLNDGTIKHYKSLKLVTGIMKAPHLLADGKLQISSKEIMAYQNHDHYAISQKGFTSGRRTYVAKETLPGFAIRIAKGKINVYTKKYYNGVAAVDEYFVQMGDDGQVLAYTTETMNLMIKDDPEALDFFMAKKYNTPKSKKDPTPASLANNKTLVPKMK